MGRWPWSNRSTVEECLVLDSAWLKKRGYFCGYKSGRLEWKNSYEEVESSIRIVVSANQPDSFENYVQLIYTITDSFRGEKLRKDYKVVLDRTPCNYGGFRYWFICPLSVEGTTCNKKVAKLYLPPGGVYFGCRNCYDLTYHCQKEHDNRLDRLLKDPNAFMSKLNSENPKDSHLALRAYMRYADLI